MCESVVKIENLVKYYKDFQALDHLNLEIKEGEVFGLLGPNGSGKSTTIGCLLALLNYQEGDIQVFGKKMEPYTYDSKKEIGVILQNVAVFDELTVWENIDYFCGLYIRDKKQRRQYVEEAISFTGLEGFKKFYPKKLSGGLLRRLNIACGIAHKPKLIVLDEPTVAVDPQSRNKILEGIAQLNRQGATIIYTSHYMEEVEQLCSRIAIMDKGKVIALGTKEELKNRIQRTEMITVEVLKGLSDEENDQKSRKLMEDIGKLDHVLNVTFQEGRLEISCSGGKHNLVGILDYMSGTDLKLGRIYSELPTLNDVFLEITGKALRD